MEPPSLPDPLTVPEAIRRRRATRHFDPDRPVPESVLGEVLRLATLAPSGFNLQPWRFIVVQSPRNRERLRACAFGQVKIAEAPVALIVLGAWHPERSHLEPILELMVRHGAITPERAAGLRVTVTRAMGRRADPALWATRSAMLAAATLMLAAEGFGIASAPMEGFEEEKVRAAFGVPDDHAVCCLIALGYAAEVAPSPGRLKLDDVCYREHFGQPWVGPQADEAAAVDRSLGWGQGL